MASASQVKAGLDDITSIIRNQRAAMEKVKSNAGLASAALGAIPTNYADELATIDAYAANSTDYFERLAKAEKAKLAAEFTALKADADAVAAINLND
jgi:hypothetical protein